MELLKIYIREHLKVTMAFLLFSVMLAVSFRLYRLPVAAVAYPAALCSAAGFAVLILDYIKALKKHREMCRIAGMSREAAEMLPPAESIAEDDMRQLVLNLDEELRKAETAANKTFSDTVDYYTMWAHQIKTPIASMKLRLQNEDSDISRKLSLDLFKIEQYAEMVMMFLKLEERSRDYVFKKYDLDSIIRETLRKFSGEFIMRKLNLAYEPSEVKVLTDEKWLSFVIEQVISNALKYTPEGSISIKLKEPCTLCIEDTGIGIAAEDLPRIFEKGYTGLNGRADKQASGIGLYLCRRICDELGHSISAVSEPGKGTCVMLGLGRREMGHE